MKRSVSGLNSSVGITARDNVLKLGRMSKGGSLSEKTGMDANRSVTRLGSLLHN